MVRLELFQETSTLKHSPLMITAVRVRLREREAVVMKGTMDHLSQQSVSTVQSESFTLVTLFTTIVPHTQKLAGDPKEWLCG